VPQTAAVPRYARADRRERGVAGPGQVAADYVQSGVEQVHHPRQRLA
jgi:hypothetical protein